ncbi:MAG: valine--tRNA ligase [Chloroflexi bacterium RBG_13_48_17]|nr:MAG: valine--tRNA ligase [Chloroflexi bacterium RBG_13_48_17]
MSEIAKAYEPAEVEKKWYRFWMEHGYFTPKIDRRKKPFVIIMPPPNVTGELHLGHALVVALEDIMIRWHRMKGESALWLPGVDHAGIATQVIVEQKLAGEGLDRHKLGREKFIERVWEWVKKSRQSITYQHQRLGASCDWTRERFTLDEGPSRAVRTAFVRLYDKGLIYRGERIINWCPRCQTALSDLEVQHKDITGNLYYLRYPLADVDGYVTVATTRPETYLGDTAVAVNPDDKRFKTLVGEKVVLPIIGRVIPVIADSAVDPSFGTGAVKITPGHDPVDFEMSERQHLPIIRILNPDATMNEQAGPYAGLDRFVCRQKVLADFEKAGLLEKIEQHHHSVGHCGRCQTMVEPEVSKQWFVKVAPLAEAATKAVTDGRIAIVPERFTKVYLNWMENIRDWCISRQLWWGHRIPVWYCRKCGELTVAIDEPSACSHCSSKDIVQDPDVLDTWFSSALWTHSTLGWPEDTEDLRYFYPTSVMETGYDILFFWVARMIMMGLEDTGDIPFHTVYLHGLIRDEKGEKMSKMRGNVMNPTDAIEEYGTDALRFAVTTGTSPGNDINLGPHRLEAGRNFANKMWNAARFIFQSLEAKPIESGVLVHLEAKRVESTEDRWILSRLNHLVLSVDELMSNFQFGEAERQIHDFFWGEFCDWYIEMAKIRLSHSDFSPLPVLAFVLEATLRLLHPFMPFITEELWQDLKQRLPEGSLGSDSIIIAPYPVTDKKFIDTKTEQVMESVIEIVRSIRNARAEHKVAASKWIEARVYTDEFQAAIASKSEAIEVLAKARPLAILGRNQRRAKDEKALVLVLKEAEVVLPWAGMVDLAAERQRLEGEISTIEREIDRLEQRLKDTAFVAKAPAAVVDKERGKLQGFKDKLARLRQELAQLN